MYKLIHFVFLMYIYFIFFTHNYVVNAFYAKLKHQLYYYSYCSVKQNNFFNIVTFILRRDEPFGYTVRIT